MNLCVFGSSSEQIDRIYIEKSELFGEELVKKGYGLVFGAGKYGVMGAVSRGAAKANGKTIIGVVPEFFKKRDVLSDNCTELVFTKTMHERKKYMEDNSEAFIVLPGSIGTYDEFFETITLKQLYQHEKPIIIYNINGYFNPMIKMLEKAIDERFMTEACLKLFSLCNTSEEVFNAVENYTPNMYDKYEF